MRAALPFLLLLPFTVHGGPAETRCGDLLISEKEAFARALHRKNPTFHITPEVMAEQARLQRRGISIRNEPVDRIVSFLDALARVHQRAELDSSARERLRRIHHDRFIIRPEDIPESYFQNQQRIARERGHGDIRITDEMRAENARILIADQRKSFDTWFDYFLSDDARHYPFHIKYWSFNAMLKLSRFDPETGTLMKRSRQTVAPFPELNREALARIADQFSRKLKGEASGEILDERFSDLLNQADFSRLYAWELKRLHDRQLEITKSRNAISGIWVRYPQGSDHMPLVRSLDGRNTGWCTAGEATAKEQLKEGDFHVFYTQDANGKPTTPRLAIRMKGGEIAEVRGIGPEQNLDEIIAGSDVLEAKLKEFGDRGNAYRKKDADMKRLTGIENRQKSGEKLSKSDLRFLYELDSKIEGFGYGRDPRIGEIRSSRDKRNDMAHLLDLEVSEISVTAQEALRPGNRLHIGDIHLQLAESPDERVVTFPETVDGTLEITGCKSGQGLKLPRYVRGSLILRDLSSDEGLIFPESVEGSLILPALKRASGGRYPDSVGGSVDLPSLVEVDHLKLPGTIGHDLLLSFLTRANGVEFPLSIGGSLDLRRLSDPYRLKLPDSVGGLLNLSSLKFTQGIRFPVMPAGSRVYLNSIRSTETLNLPEGFKAEIFRDSLQQIPQGR